MPAPGGIPLAVLRADLDRGWPTGSRWTTTGGIGGTALEQPAGSELAFSLGAEERPLRLRGSLELAAPVPGRAPVRLRVSTLDRAGVETVLWTGALKRFAGHVLPSGRRLDARFELPGGGSLVFSVQGPAGAAVRWRECEIDFEDADGASPRVPHPARPRLAVADAGAGQESPPRFSILLPVHDPPPEVLEETIASVRAQTFGDWELCLVDDGSADPAVRETLRRSVAADRRLRLARRDTAGGIASATNAALASATGEYVALLDHDDLLEPDALAEVEEALRERPGTDMVYSDEVVTQEGGTTFTFAKPHWSPDLLRSQMYTCHLGVYRRELALEVGGFRSEFDGSQDFDFALRISERTDRIVHIPRILYRWRAHAGSTAASTQAKPSAYPVARRAIVQHLERSGTEAEVHFGPWQGIYRVVHRLPPEAEVALAVVSSGGGEPLRHFAAAAADGASSGVRNPRVEVADTAAAAWERCAGADAIVLCEGPAIPLTRFWLARLAAFALQPGVAAVGARTVAPGGLVEDGGFAIEDGLPAPIMYGAGAGDPGPLGVGLLPANVAAFAGVVAFPGEVLRRLGGPDPELGGLATPDLCLRGLSDGLRVVSAPDVLLRRHGRAGPLNELSDLELFRRRWRTEFAGDPYFDLSVCWPGVAVTPTGSG